MRSTSGDMATLRLLHCQPGIEEAGSAEVIESALAATRQDFHFRVTVATHPFRVLEHLEEQRFDAVILHREPPFLSAREVLTIARTGNDRTPMFLLVEQDRLAGLSEEDRRGFVDVVPLPFSANHILRALQPVMTHILELGTGPFVPAEPAVEQAPDSESVTVEASWRSAEAPATDSLSVRVEPSEEVEYFDFEGIPTSIANLSPKEITSADTVDAKLGSKRKPKRMREF